MAAIVGVVFVLSALVAGGCRVSYKFNGASIDYSKVKSISISDFPNYAPLVYDMLSIKFNEEIRDIYATQTRLNQVSMGGDLHIEGSITGYHLTPLSIGSDALAAENRLTLTIKVTFVDNSNPDVSFENRSFSANRTFESSYSLNDVQEALVDEMIEEIVDQIYNATVANW